MTAPDKESLLKTVLACVFFPLLALLIVALAGVGISAETPASERLIVVAAIAVALLCGGVVARILFRRPGRLLVLSREASAWSPRTVPFEIVEVPGAEALARWEALRAEAAGTATIVILDDLEVVIPSKAERRALLEQASRVDVRAWLQERGAELRERGRPGEEYPPLGDWPADAGGDVKPEPWIYRDVLTRKPKERVFLAKIPTPRSWEAPAYLGLGGWNDCPPPEILVAVSRFWYEACGAQIAGATDSILEYRVGRPPSDRAAAEALAAEHFLVCPDSVDQGAGTLRNLAAGLVDSPWWFFWWD
jgi:hypothetical protein